MPIETKEPTKPLMPDDSPPAMPTFICDQNIDGICMVLWRLKNARSSGVMPDIESREERAEEVLPKCKAINCTLSPELERELQHS